MLTTSVVGLAAGLFLFAPALLGTSHELPRSATDRADDRRGSQIHVVYALPSDGGDRALDTDGTIEASVRNFQSWLKGQTGGKGLRLDTYQSQLDISFHRLSQTDAQLASRGVFLRDAIEQELRAAGFDQPGKLYAVYYDGSNAVVCGGGAWPPVLPGVVGAVYLRATFGGSFLCYDPSRSRSGLQIMDLAVLHELLHTIGVVATCAPHHTRSGHVSDSPSDLMWAGEGSWIPTTLDVGRDDYFSADVPGCLDLADSLYLDGDEPQPPPPPPPAPTRPKLSVAVRGPGRVTSVPAGIACPRRCSATFATGTRVVLRASPQHRLQAWSGACGGKGRCVIRMDRNRAVRAFFKR